MLIHTILRLFLNSDSTNAKKQSISELAKRVASFSIPNVTNVLVANRSISNLNEEMKMFEFRGWDLKTGDFRNEKGKERKRFLT